ncbi:MAG TPA: hypothetical protein H9692_00570 [Firmicutes bacterium]|nr:hypothetical protein [Bacillota bacterium]
MFFAYEFDTFGIIYTVIAAALIVALVAALIVFCAVRAKAGRGTVAFRVLDVILIVLLAALWAAYILMRLGIFAADGNGLSLYASGEVLFTLPACGSAVVVTASVLGTLLLAAASALAVIDLILSFALRRKSVEKSVYSDAPEDVATVPLTLSEIMPEQATEPAEVEPEEVMPEQATEPAEVEPAEAMPEQAEEPAEVEPAEVIPEQEQEPAEVEPEEAEEPAEVTPEEVAPEVRVIRTEPRHERAERREEERTATIITDGDARRQTSRKKYASALQRPGAKKSVRTAAEITAEAEEEAPPQHKAEEIAHAPLPITRKLVITNRMNVVNMYNEYLREKKAHEREKISSFGEDDK